MFGMFHFSRIALVRRQLFSTKQISIARAVAIDSHDTFSESKCDNIRHESNEMSATVAMFAQIQPKVDWRDVWIDQPPYKIARLTTAPLKTVTLNCGEIRKCHQGLQIELSGKVNCVRMDRFLELKDQYGVIQLVAPIDNISLCRRFSKMPLDSFIKIIGVVKTRPEKLRNTTLETGDVEVHVQDIVRVQKFYRSDHFQSNVVNRRCYSTSTSNAAAQQQVQPATKSPVDESAINVNEFTDRTHNCGELTEKDEGKNVTLCGWLEFSRMNKFLVLRDGYGHTQVLIPEDRIAELNIDKLSFETILKIEGKVLLRPPKMINKKMKTGAIEVLADKLEILNPSKSNLPFIVRSQNRPDDSLRMEYRYIDLRFADMQKNLRMRSNVLMKMREFLINRIGFVEVETPTLFRRTPGGAQEFVVPTQMAGHFYSLVQSPQQFKQMLMAGAIDRYFQIARCYRDETTTPNRQPEFTQLDIELSFTSSDGVMQLTENILEQCWPAQAGTIDFPFPRMTFDDAMNKYGSDKPDTRYDCLLLDNVTDAFAESKTNSSFGAFAIVLRNEFSTFSNNVKKSLSSIASNFDVKFLNSKITNDIESWTTSGIGGLDHNVAKQIADQLKLQTKDTILLAIGSKSVAQNLLGKIRLDLIDQFIAAKKMQKVSDDIMKFMWIVDFPLFTLDEKTGTLETTHHPFTAPHPDDFHLLSNPEDFVKCRSLAYDLVLNGNEIGGGSIRIHNASLQRRIINEILHLESSHLTHLIDALESGCPPHGGIALGIDRLLSIICRTNSIRDVIAFPKSTKGKDLLSKAPFPISRDELDLYHLQIKTSDKSN